MTIPARSHLLRTELKPRQHRLGISRSSKVNMANLMGPQVGQQSNFAGGVVDQQGVEVQRRFVEFLQTFTVDEDVMPTSQTSQHSQQQLLEYVDQAMSMKNEEHTTLYVDFRHVLQSDPTLAEALQLAFYRYEPFLRKGVQVFIRSIPETAQYVQGSKATRNFRIFLQYDDCRART